MKKAPFSIVCVSSQPWAAQLPTNRQQIMVRAARRGHHVLFVETSDFAGRHLARLARGRDGIRALKRLFYHERMAPGVSATKALNLLPWGQKYDLANRVNTALTAKLLRRAVGRLPEPVVLWVYDPTAARLIGSLGEAFAVYDCVDAYEQQAGADPVRRRLVGDADARAAARSRLVFTTTRTLFERQLERNRRTHLVPNVGDYEHFRAASDRSYAADDVRGLSRPVIGFAGNFLPSKVDFDLLEAIASARPNWSVLLVGPVPTAARDHVDRLQTHQNVRWLGRKPYEQLPRYVAAFDVGLIPYVENEYTRSCFPLKLYEYLAAGKPVVASGLPELVGMGPDVAVAGESTDVIAAIERAVAQDGDDDRARRQAVAARNTWETRTETLLELTSAELER